MGLITRRRALGAVAATVGVGATSIVVLGAYCARRSPAASVAHGLALAFDDPAHPVLVGRRYLATHADDSDAASLGLAVARAVTESRLHVRCQASAAAALRARNAEEFRAGRVVWIDGWMMGLTEARVCALMALDADRSRRA